jgi:hypothetical protein
MGSHGCWRREVPENFYGFNTTLKAGHLDEACSRLGVERYGAPHLSSTNRSISCRAKNASGEPSWIKLSAICPDSKPAEWLRQGEQESSKIEGVAMPRLLQAESWSDSGWVYCALQMSLIESCAEPSPWAGLRANRVEDCWLADLRVSLANLRRVKTSRQRIKSEAVLSGIKAFLDDDAPSVVEDWVTTHGDLHWGNLTFPKLALVDWEWWGMGPRGLDEAYILTYACAQPRLLRRLYDAFADQVHTESGRVSLLWVLCEALCGFKYGVLDPSYKEYVEDMFRSVRNSRYPRL